MKKPEESKYFRIQALTPPLFVLLHCPGVIVLILSESADTTLLGVVLLMLAQFLFGFWWLTVLNRGFYPQDIRVAFLGITTLCTVWFPLVNVMKLELSPIWSTPYSTFDLVQASVSGLLAIIGANLAFVLFPVRWKNWEIIQRRRLPHGWRAILFYSLLSIGILVFAVSQLGNFSVYSVLAGGQVIDRVEVFAAFTAPYIVSVTLFAGFFVFFCINYNNFNRISGYFILVLTIFLILSILGSGNRREILPMFLAGIATWLIHKNQQLRLKTGILLIIVFIIGLFIGSIRMGDPLSWALTVNDFTVVYNSPLLLLHNHYQNWFLGTTYLQVFLLPLPRAYFPWKPLPTTTIITNAFSSYGLPTNGGLPGPMTEGFLNFGLVGPGIILFLTGMFLIFVVRVRKLNPGLYLSLYVMLFDYYRTSFANLFAYFLLVYGGYLFLEISIRRLIKFEQSLEKESHLESPNVGLNES